MTLSSKPDFDLEWCFSTLGCADLDLSEITALARQHHIGLVELRAVSGRMDLPNLFAEVFGDEAKLRHWLDEEGVKIASLDSSAKLIGCPAEARQELLDFARWAQPLGIRSIRVFDGGQFDPVLSDSDRRQAIDFLTWWEDEKKAHRWDVELIIETHDALCQAAHCRALADACDFPIHILWDAHHTWKKGKEDPMKTWSEMKDLVRHIHFKDSISVPSARHPFTYVGLGEGEFDLSALIDRLRLDQFSGPVSLEWERQWHPYMDPLEVALGQLEAFRRPHLSSSV